MGFQHRPSGGSHFSPYIMLRRQEDLVFRLRGFRLWPKKRELYWALVYLLQPRTS